MKNVWLLYDKCPENVWQMCEKSVQNMWQNLQSVTVPSARAIKYISPVCLPLVFWRARNVDGENMISRRLAEPEYHHGCSRIRGFRGVDARARALGWRVVTLSRQSRASRGSRTHPISSSIQKPHDDVSHGIWKVTNSLQSAGEHPVVSSQRRKKSEKKTQDKSR